MKSCPVPLLLNNPRTSRFRTSQPRHSAPGFKDRVIETFDGGADKTTTKIQCTKVENDQNKNPSNNVFYTTQRENNIKQLRKQYNAALGDYLQKYNDHQVADSLNSQGSFSLKNDVQQAENKLNEIQSALHTNNEDTERLIKNNEKALTQKGKLIEQKNARIAKQQAIIQERNDILNSRKRQIEMGLEKNIYKRNLMYFLIFVNIIVILVLVGLIHRSS